MTEEQASSRAVELIRKTYAESISFGVDDNAIIAEYCDECSWFMAGWKETMKTLTTQPPLMVNEDDK